MTNVEMAPFDDQIFLMDYHLSLLNWSFIWHWLIWVLSF